MENRNYIEVQLTIEIETPNNSIEIVNRQIYFFDNVYTEKKLDCYDETYKLLKMFERVRMATIDVIRGNLDNYRDKENLYSIRFIDRGAQMSQIATMKDGCFNFDNEPETALTVTEFCKNNLPDYHDRALYHQIENRSVTV